MEDREKKIEQALAERFEWLTENAGDLEKHCLQLQGYSEWSECIVLSCRRCFDSNALASGIMLCERNFKCPPLLDILWRIDWKVTPAQVEYLLKHSHPCDWVSLQELNLTEYHIEKRLLAVMNMTHEQLLLAIRDWNPALLLHVVWRWQFPQLNSVAKNYQNSFLFIIKCLDRLHHSDGRFVPQFTKILEHSRDSLRNTRDFDAYTFRGIVTQKKDVIDLELPFYVALHVFMRRRHWLKVFQRKCKRWYDTPNIWREDLEMWVSRDMLQQFKKSKKCEATGQPLQETS